MTDDDLTNIILLIPNTLIKLDFDGKYKYFPLSFISNLRNLQELQLSFGYDECFKDFEKLQYVILPQLQILKIQFAYPRTELLIKFLEINGRNLKELYLGDIKGNSDDLLNLAIAKFCTNLRKLSTRFKNDELKMLKTVF